MNEKILKAIKELRKKTKKRKFSQTFDLIVNLKEFDVKKPENRFSENIVLPFGRGKNAEVVIFSDTIKDVDCKVLTSEDVNKLAKEKRAAKKLSAKTDFFLAEPKLMPAIGKALGRYLAPRQKMPILITEANVKSLIENYRKSVRIVIKDSPVIQCPVGKEEMKDEEIEENIKAVLKRLEERLPRGKHNIAKILLKLTMSKPEKIEV